MRAARLVGAIVAGLLAALLLATPAVAAGRFPDVPSSNPYQVAIEGLAALDIVGGYSNGNFGPSDLVKRMQFAKMIVLTMHLPVTPYYQSTFHDTPAANPSNPLYPGSYVAVATACQIIQGYTVDNTFRFDNNISRQQVISMVVRAAGSELQDPPVGWVGALNYSDSTHGQNIRKAEYNRLLEGLVGLSGTWNGSQNATRGECAQMLWNLLNLAPSHIVLTSDQSVVLPQRGSSYQLAAVIKDATGQVLTQPISWQSSDPTAVSVCTTGTVTAEAAVGSATITVSSPGAKAAVASVIVAKPAARTVLVPSSDVISVGSSTAVLKADETTRGIIAGDTVMSGSTGGLFATVQAVNMVGDEVDLVTTPGALTQAFEQLKVHLVGAPQSVSLVATGEGSAGVIPNNASSSLEGDSPLLPMLTQVLNGPTTPDLQAAGVGINGPSVRVQVTFQPEIDLESDWLTGVHLFKFAIHLTAPVTISTGAITISSGSEAEKDYEILSRHIDSPSPLWLMGIEISPSVDLSAGLQVKASAQGALTVNGPTLTETLQATEGVQYTSQAGWQAIEDNPTVVPSVIEASSNFTCAFGAEIDPYVHLDAGFSANLLGVFSLSNVDLAYLHADGSLSLNLNTPFGDHQAGYTGPQWGAGLDLSAGPELNLEGPVKTLLDFIHISAGSASAQWKLFEWEHTWPGSPDPTVTATPATLTTGAVTLAASITAGLEPLDGDKVEFVGYKDGASQGTVLASTTLRSGAASAKWQPVVADNGSYQIVALLFDPIFGAVNLPYASSKPAALTVHLGAGNSNAPRCISLPGLIPAPPGDMLHVSCSPGSWTGNPAPSITYQWLRDGSPMAGATHSVYTFQSADYGHWITCQVTASNSAGHVTVLAIGLVAP